MVRKAVLMVSACLGAAILLAGVASAQECSSGCGAQLKACVRNARADGFACKLACLSGAPAEGRRACLEACGESGRNARGTCKTAIESCIGTCAPKIVTPEQQSCLAPCANALGECARTVVDDVKACLAPCRDAADRSACWRDCVSGARDGATACGTDLSACASGCGVTPPAWPTPPPTDSCAAQCRADLRQCLGAVTSTALACSSTCFGGANAWQCLSGCKSTAEASAATCRGTDDSCTVSCQ